MDAESAARFWHQQSQVRVYSMLELDLNDVPWFSWLTWVTSEAPLLPNCSLTLWLN